MSGAGTLAAYAGTGGRALVPWALASGVVLFFLSEYGTHRFLLHARPARSEFIRRLQHRLHYDHHVRPARLDLLFLPAWFLVPVLAAFATLYAALWHDAGVVVSLLLGNVLGLLYYEWVHYVAHVPYRARTSLGREMKRYHLRHHFLNERLWFGVTNPGLDRLAGTYAAAADAERSATTRDLFP